jgi:hypothetical protein
MDRFRRDGGRALSAAVVGLGYWGPNLLRGLLEQPAVDVSYICDLDEERLGAFARQYPGAKPTTRYEDLLEDPARPKNWSSRHRCGMDERPSGSQTSSVEQLRIPRRRRDLRPLRCAPASLTHDVHR